MMIYQPAEDSYLMKKVLDKEIPKLLEQNPELKVLEIGCGSGIQLQTLESLGVKKQNIFSCDVNSDAVAHCEKLGFDCVESDLFKNVNGKFDLIVFNPPYLPEEKDEPVDSMIATTGGKNGSEIINQFLKHAKDRLVAGGKIFLITSSLTKNINWLDWKRKKLGERKIFMEKIWLWKLI